MTAWHTHTHARRTIQHPGNIAINIPQSCFGGRSVNGLCQEPKHSPTAHPSFGKQISFELGCSLLRQPTRVHKQSMDIAHRAHKQRSSYIPPPCVASAVTESDDTEEPSGSSTATLGDSNKADGRNSACRPGNVFNTHDTSTTNTAKVCNTATTLSRAATKTPRIKHLPELPWNQQLQQLQQSHRSRSHH